MIPLKRSKIKVSFETPDDKKRINKSLYVVTSSVQYFLNSQHLLFKLQKDARAFYDYLCECMNGSNMITITADLNQNFIEHFLKVTSKKNTIKKTSVPKYISKLIELG